MKAAAMKTTARRTRRIPLPPGYCVPIGGGAGPGPGPGPALPSHDLIGNHGPFTMAIVAVVVYAPAIAFAGTTSFRIWGDTR